MPPQSSQVIKIAVSDQYGLEPMALTMEATHAGPEPSVDTGWSDDFPGGVTQLTDARLPREMSVSTCAGGFTILVFQSGPVHTPPVGALG